MTNSKNFKITVTQARPRKPKVQSSETKQYTNQLLDLIENPEFLVGVTFS